MYSCNTLHYKNQSQTWRPPWWSNETDHSLPSAHTFKSVIGSLNVWDYFRFNTLPDHFFSKHSGTMLSCICLKNQVFVILLIYHLPRLYGELYISLTKYSALVFIHCIEVPIIMRVSLSRNLLSI
jgi:hypothetical protein